MSPYGHYATSPEIAAYFDFGLSHAQSPHRGCGPFVMPTLDKVQFSIYIAL